MRLKELLKGLEYTFSGDINVEIKGVSHRAQACSANYLYVCLIGAVDGHNYIGEALSGGCRAIVVSSDFRGEIESGVTAVCLDDTRYAYAVIANNYYANPAAELSVIGITGTNGKTTTANILAHILEAQGHRTGIIGTLGAYSPNHEMISGGMTTPDPMELYRAIRRIADEGGEYAVMEVSAHAIALKKTAPIEFAALIFTNLSQDHLDYFKDMAHYEITKHSLFLNSGAKKIINRDDESGKRLIERLKRGAGFEKSNGIITCSVIEQKSVLNEFTPDFYAVLYNDESVGYVSKGIEYTARISALPGKFNAYNSLQAIAASTALGLDFSASVDALKSFKGVAGRFNAIEKYGIKIIIDFAHTPDGLTNLLKEARRMSKGKVIAVFGAGGNRDASKRPVMGAAAEVFSDIIILTEDNPRYERAEDISEAIASGIANKNKLICIRERDKAITRAIELAGAGDVIAIAGKGHENYIEKLGEKIPYSDEECVRRILAAMPNAKEEK